MNRTSHPLIRLGVLATVVVGMMLASGGRAMGRTCVDQQTGSLRFCPRSSDGYDGSSTIPVPAEQVSDNSNQTLQWVLLAAAVLSALAVVAVVADLLARRRWHQPPLEAALETSDADELPEPPDCWATGSPSRTAPMPPNTPTGPPSTSTTNSGRRSPRSPSPTSCTIEARTLRLKRSWRPPSGRATPEQSQPHRTVSSSSRPVSPTATPPPAPSPATSKRSADSVWSIRAIAVRRQR